MTTNVVFDCVNVYLAMELKMSTEAKSSIPKSNWWRTVLGEYPTGVTIITSVDLDTNDKVGMVVGTFSAVSENPPMISFMPSKGSRSYATIAANGRFTANVLGAGHEGLCRAFGRGLEEKFDLAQWVTNEHGISRLVDAVSWFEAKIVKIVDAGDHDIVLAEVEGFGVGNGDAGMPLLFLKGGYGSFTVPQLEFNVQGFGSQIRQAEAIRREISELGEELNTECYIAGLTQGSIVVLSGVNLGGHTLGHETVGQSFSFAAPVASVFVAWGSSERQKTWEENSRFLLGEVNRPLINEMLERVRNRGFSVTVGKALIESFERIIGNPDSKHSEISDIWSQLSAEYESFTAGQTDFSEVTAVQVPVFDENGEAKLELYVGMPDWVKTQADFEKLTSTTLAAARRLTGQLGGVLPQDYPR